MTMTQFAMVEELASLVKDNLPCKHLILSVEKALVNFLQDDTRSDGVLELEPMNSYNRLLLHRLADIFGFAHESVGEGDERHILLERCPETSIPSILVGDILWQYDEPESLTTSHQLLRRKESLPVLTKTSFLQDTFEEREAAYLAARERIFSADVGERREAVRQKPRNIPVVARRMIAHALGKRITSCDENATGRTCGGNEGQTKELHTQERDHETDSNEGAAVLPDKTMSSHDKTNHNNTNVLVRERNESGGKRCPNGRSGNGVSKDSLKEEHLGAAKRMFALALGRQSAKDAFVSKSSEVKQVTESD